jgi:hypothetical protein
MPVFVAQYIGGPLCGTPCIEYSPPLYGQERTCQIGVRTHLYVWSPVIYPAKLPPQWRYAGCRVLGKAGVK